MFDRDIEEVKFVEISDDGVNIVNGEYAGMRLKFLKTFKEDELNILINENRLEEHLITIELNSEKRFNELVEYEKIKNSAINNSNNITDNIVEQIEKMVSSQVEEELIFV